MLKSGVQSKAARKKEEVIVQDLYKLELTLTKIEAAALCTAVSLLGALVPEALNGREKMDLLLLAKDFAMRSGGDIDILGKKLTPLLDSLVETERKRIGGESAK